MQVEIKWDPHDEQERVLDAGARFRTVCWGRRSGKTELAIIDQLTFAIENPESICWWIAPSYQQANDYGFDRMLEKVPDVLLDGEPKRSAPREIPLITGSVIIFKSAEKPENLKGGGVDHAVVDEAASIPDIVWHEYIRPTLSDTMGDALFISTPKGKDWFYERYQKGDSDDRGDHASFHATSYCNPEVPDEEIDQVREEIPDRIFRQEYLAEFLDDAGVVFTEINVDDYEYEARDGEQPYDIGVDFARHHNWTVIVAIDGAGRVVEFERTQAVTWNEIEAIVRDVYERYPGVCHVDASRDNKIVEDLEQSRIPVEAVRFTTQTKREMIENLATKFEKGEVTVPEELTTLRRELEQYEYDVTSRGNVRYHAPEGEHDDCVDALALAARGGDERSATW